MVLYLRLLGAEVINRVPYVVLGVATSPKNTGHRSWIRRTWMTLPNVVSGAVHTKFLIGVLTPHGIAHAPHVRAQVLMDGEGTLASDYLWGTTQPKGRWHHVALVSHHPLA